MAKPPRKAKGEYTEINLEQLDEVIAQAKQDLDCLLHSIHRMAGSRAKTVRLMRSAEEGTNEGLYEKDWCYPGGDGPDEGDTCVHITRWVKVVITICRALRDDRLKR